MNTEPMPMNDDDYFAEASAWHFRLLAEDASDEERTAFAAWLAQGEAQARAWSEAQALLAVLQPAARAVHTSRLSWTRRSVPWAAAAMLVLALGLAWQAPWLDRLRADHYTVQGETRAIELADGSRLQLDTDAAVSVTLAGDERRVRLLRGEAWFEVSHDAARPFIVESGDAQVRVLGTTFAVARLEGRTRILLSEGRIEARAGSEKPVVLAPGEEVEVSAGQLSARRTFDPQQAFAWRQRQLVFRQQPLAEVVAELDRYWPGHTLVLGEALRQKKVSGVFEIDKPDAVLKALTHTLGLNVDQYASYLRVLREG